MRTTSFIHSRPLQSPNLFSRQRKKWSKFSTKAQRFASLLHGFILGGSVAGFTGSCSRLIPHSKSTTQRPQSWFLGTRSKAVGVKLHSNKHLPAIDMRTNGLEALLLNFKKRDIGLLIFINECEGLIGFESLCSPQLFGETIFFCLLFPGTKTSPCCWPQWSAVH